VLIFTLNQSVSYNTSRPNKDKKTVCFQSHNNLKFPSHFSVNLTILPSLMKTGFVYFKPGSTSSPLEGKLRFSRPFRDRVHGWKQAVLHEFRVHSYLTYLLDPTWLSSTSYGKFLSDDQGNSFTKLFCCIDEQGKTFMSFFLTWTFF